MALGSVEAQEICDVYPARIDLIRIDVLLYPPAVPVDHARNLTPRVLGDNLIPIMRERRWLSRILLTFASAPWTQDDEA